VPGTGHGEARHHEVGLARNAQGLAAGREYLQLRAAPEQAVGKLRARLHQVLAVVQNDQDLQVAEVIGYRFAQGTAGDLRHVQGSRDGLRHEVGVGDGCEPHPPRPVLESLDEMPGRRPGEPRLASAPWAAQREETPFREQPLYIRELPLAPDEARALQRQIVCRALRRTRGGRLHPGRTHCAQPTGTSSRRNFQRCRLWSTRLVLTFLPNRTLADVGRTRISQLGESRFERGSRTQPIHHQSPRPQTMLAPNCNYSAQGAVSLRSAARPSSQRLARPRCLRRTLRLRLRLSGFGRRVIAVCFTAATRGAGILAAWAKNVQLRVWISGCVSRR
jgi:hypothetical protein